MVRVNERSESDRGLTGSLPLEAPPSAPNSASSRGRRSKSAEEPSSYRTKAELATDVLRQAILSGQLLPGDPLIVIALSERFGLTLMPLREALSRLAAEQLVEIQPHRPARVASLSRERLEEEYFVRAVLEGAAAGQATGRIDEHGFEELGSLLRRMEEAKETGRAADYWNLTRRFHARIYEFATSALLRDEVKRLRARTLRYLTAFSRDQQLVPQAQEEHREILEALKGGDPATAERLVRTHVARVAQAVCLS